MQRQFLLISSAVFSVTILLGFFWPRAFWSLALTLPLFVLGVRDVMQTRRAVRRNFPVIGHFRYLLEAIRPEINQYFIESDTDGTPFSREQRSVAYTRAKQVLSTTPFGTQRDLYAEGVEWINHSLEAVRPNAEAPRIRFGGPDCKLPYDASLLNISAMSFGSLSSNAVRALNEGARMGGFYHNTGEGGISPHHRAGGGDLVWQVGTGYFGCRRADGGFDPERFRESADYESVRMIEIKLSQGAKPGHGGILPAAKITPEIAEIRGVPLGEDVLSPPMHSAFRGPRGLLEFVARLRELSGGKPVGFKLCLGNPSEFVAIARAMHETGIVPDYVAVDGSEGGTGAAPPEFSNSVGWPLTEGLVFVHNVLVGFGVRDRLKIVASGKIVTGFDMAKRLAVGADTVASARGMMFALGCIQARRCNSNHCPVGVATQDAGLVRGLSVSDKSKRVRNFHHESVHALLELLGAAGLAHPDELRPEHILRRISPTKVRNYAQIYPYVEPRSMLEEPPPEAFSAWMGGELAAHS